MSRDLKYAIEVFVERFGRGALNEAIVRYRDSIAAGNAQQALAWRCIADGIEDLSDADGLRSVH